MAMSRPIAVVALMLAVASSFGCAGRTGADGRGALWRKASPTSAAPELQRVNTLLADLAERLRPGLVHVRVRRAAGSEAAGEEPGEPRRSTGSGFVIDPSGLIVTNAHVVEGAESIQVRLSDGRRFAGNLVGHDTRVDLALIKIQHATKGRVEWGWLGVSIGEVTEADLERLKLREPRGVLVRDVMPGEPAERGGVRANDVIVEFDGAALEGPRDLQRAVSTTPVGKRVRVMVLRDGRETEVEVTVGLYQERETPRPERPRPPPGEVLRAATLDADHEADRARVVRAHLQVREQHRVRVAGPVHRHEGERHAQARRGVTLREALDEQRRE